jgi:probable rRNA maturation factor
MTAAALEISWTVGGPRLLSDEEIRRTVAAALSRGGRPGMRLALVFVSDRALARMHARYLHDPRPTDVLAFDLGTAGHGPDGELYVSAERARAEARARGLPPDRELALYIVHGCLHLCGFDDHDPVPRRRMRAAERVVLAALGFAQEQRRA